MCRIIPSDQTPASACVQGFVPPVCNGCIVEQRVAPIGAGQIVTKDRKQEGANNSAVGDDHHRLSGIGLANALNGMDGACRKLLPTFTGWRLLAGLLVAHVKGTI